MLDEDETIRVLRQEIYTLRDDLKVARNERDELRAETNRLQEAIQHVLKFDSPRLPYGVASRLSDAIHGETVARTADEITEKTNA